MTSTTASHDQVDPEASNEGPKRLASLRLRAITLTKELVWFTRDIDQIVEDQQDLRHKVSRLHIDLVDCIQATEAFSFSVGRILSLFTPTDLLISLKSQRRPH